MTTALITGGSGRIARDIRPHLAERGWRVRLLDEAPVPDALRDSEQRIGGSILDDRALGAAMRDVDLVVHLAAHPAERPWPEILSVNIDGTERVLRAAADAGVRHVLSASSVHAVGAIPWSDIPTDPVPLPRPDSYYGASKATGEALCALYAERFGMSIVSVRIINATGRAETPRERVCTFTPADIARLAEATLTWEGRGHRIVWGVSRGAEPWVPLTAGREVGFDPEDDITHAGDHDHLPDERIGQEFFDHPLGEPM